MTVVFWGWSLLSVGVDYSLVINVVIGTEDNRGKVDMGVTGTTAFG